MERTLTNTEKCSNMPPKRKRNPPAKSTGPESLDTKKATESSALEDYVVLRNGSKISRKAMLTPQSRKHKHSLPSVPIVSQADAATLLPTPHVAPVATGPSPPAVKPLTRECIVCQESKPCTGSQSEFPSTTDWLPCTHQFHICRPCFVQHIAIDWKDNGMDELSCPECSKCFLLQTLERFAGHEIHAKYLDNILNYHHDTLTALTDTGNSPTPRPQRRTLTSAGAFVASAFAASAKYTQTSPILW